MVVKEADGLSGDGGPVDLKTHWASMNDLGGTNFGVLGTACDDGGLLRFKPCWAVACVGWRRGGCLTKRWNLDQEMGLGQRGTEAY